MRIEKSVIAVNDSGKTIYEHDVVVLKNGKVVSREGV